MRSLEAIVRLAALSVLSCLCIPQSAQANALLDQGIHAYQTQNYTEAARLLTEAEGSNFDDPYLHYYLANSLAKLSRMNEATKHYKLAIDMSHDAKLTAYCQQALSSQAPAPIRPAKIELSEEKRIAPPPKVSPEIERASQLPQVYMYLCGCPLCHRVESMINALHVEYGDKVSFIRVMKDATDHETQAVIKTYNITECPTVLLFNNQGALVNTFTKVMPEQTVRNQISALSTTTNYTHMATTQDAHLLATRKAIVDELNGRIAADRVRIDNEIESLHALQAQDEEIARSSSRSGRVMSPINYAEKIRILETDFSRRKIEYINDADSRLRAAGIQESATEIVPRSNFQD